MLKPLLVVTLVGCAAAAGPLAAQGRGAATPAGNGSDNRLICRRMPETGSLAATRRQCFTRAEWDRIAASQRAGAQQVVDGLSTRPGGN